MGGVPIRPREQDLLSFRGWSRFCWGCLCERCRHRDTRDTQQITSPQFGGNEKKRLCVFATSTKRILGQIAKFMYLRLCDFTCCVFVFLGTLQLVLGPKKRTTTNLLTRCIPGWFWQEDRHGRCDNDEVTDNKNNEDDDDQQRQLKKMTKDDDDNENERAMRWQR